MKAARVRFYFDADVLGLAHIVCSLRTDSTYPGDPGADLQKRRRPPCPIASPHQKDSAWIPIVAQHGWLIITRDSKIATRVPERKVVDQHNARLVAISGRDGTNKWNQLEILMIQWRRLVRLQREEGPFIYSATRTSLRKIH